MSMADLALQVNWRPNSQPGISTITSWVAYFVAASLLSGNHALLDCNPVSQRPSSVACRDVFLIISQHVVQESSCGVYL